MEMVLTGAYLSAEEAYRAGLVTKITSKERFLAEAIALAETIAGKPPMAVKLAKDAVNAVNELALSDGLEYERRLFYSLFATEDQKEGMKAFLEKRKPNYTGR